MAESMVDRILRKQDWMDPVADLIQKVTGAIYGALGPVGSGLKDLMHGTKPLGHPLHPALTDMPLGAWTVGVVLDFAAMANHLIPTQAGDIALVIGTVAAAGAVVTGYTDFHETYGLERRTGLTHGLIMTTVFLLELVSVGFRGWGSSGLHPAAVGLALIAVLLAALGMYFGGHMPYAFGTMVNHNAWSEGPEDYVVVGRSADFVDGELRKVEAGGMIALLVRRGAKLHAIGNVCSHAGGPLDEGTLEGDVVTCPWHGSKFCVVDGAVKGGPATFAQPLFRVREQDGEVSVQLTTPTH